MAKDLRQPKYKMQYIPNKKKSKPDRKEKHKGARYEINARKPLQGD
jgi:hypothetical protein